ncbi:MAG: gliding motility-associated C-terminal domain-containing protein, partial [Bacteroidales bacterium]|nr:gliding motility-associated C-terminal domain-containing protein [Bacteroidales bacterium]
TFSFDTEYCLSGSAGSLPGTSDNGYTGTWSPATINTSIAGSQAYIFTPTAGLCATTTSMDVEIIEIELNVSMTGSQCYGGNGSFSFTASGGSGTYSYTVNGVSATSPYSAVAGTYTVVVSDGTCSTSQSITLTQAELLEAYYTKTNVTCNGGNNGSIDVTVEGGTTPYSFAWNDGNVTTEDRTGLVSGTYSVVVTDANGCSTSINNIAIIQPSAVNVIGVISHVACFNGSTGGIVTTTIGGNTGGYTYSWSSSQQTANIIGVIAGTYTVTATDSQGCTGTASFVITQPDAISISSQLSHPICNAQTNGGVVLTVSGGSPNYTYQWNPAGIGGSGTQNLSGVGAGTYNVTVTDSHSCTSTATYTITEPTAISVSETIVNTTCDLPNGSISINTSGGTPQYTYQWDAAAQDATTPAVSNLNNQLYTVTVSDANQCTVVDTISVERDIPPTLSLVEQINETCSDTNAVITVEVIDGNPLFTYEWSIDLEHNSPTISDIPAGDHLVVVTDADGCVDSLTIVITNHEAQEVGVAAISPAHCDQSDGGASLDVIGGSGTYTYDWGTSPPRTSIHEIELPGGQYTVTVNDGVCDVEVIVDVPNMPGPTVNASANPNEVSVSKALIRFDDGSEGATSWNWDFDNGQYSIDQRPNFKYEMPGTYIVVITVSDDYGCTASDTVTVIVLEELVVWIPNAFTPDSDGLNEFFGPVASGMSLDGYEMIIYDRWGKQAFISNDYYHRWDGKINGQKVTMNGVFVYRIVIYDTLGKDFIFTGRVSLIFGLE